jgi:hypothetical protein
MGLESCQHIFMWWRRKRSRNVQLLGRLGNPLKRLQDLVFEYIYIYTRLYEMRSNAASMTSAEIPPTRKFQHTRNSTYKKIPTYKKITTYKKPKISNIQENSKNFKRRLTWKRNIGPKIWYVMSNFGRVAHKWFIYPCTSNNNNNNNYYYYLSTP